MWSHKIPIQLSWISQGVNIDKTQGSILAGQHQTDYSPPLKRYKFELRFSVGRDWKCRVKSVQIFATGSRRIELVGILARLFEGPRRHQKRFFFRGNSLIGPELRIKRFAARIESWGSGCDGGPALQRPISRLGIYGNLFTVMRIRHPLLSAQYQRSNWKAWLMMPH
jgi:hypothetical protein